MGKKCLYFLFFFLYGYISRKLYVEHLRHFQSLPLKDRKCRSLIFCKSGLFMYTAFDQINVRHFITCHSKRFNWIRGWVSDRKTREDVQFRKMQKKKNNNLQNCSSVISNRQYRYIDRVIYLNVCVVFRERANGLKKVVRGSKELQEMS